MKNLKLLGRLHGSDMVTLLLQKMEDPEHLNYYIFASSINYSIVVSGVCEGSLQSEFKTFNILLSSLIPLLEKGHAFKVQYIEGLLEFVSAHGKLRIAPLCVEYNDPSVVAQFEKYQEFMGTLASMDSSAQRIMNARLEVQSLERKNDNLQRMSLEGAMTSSDPFSEPAPPKDLTEQLVEKQKQLTELERAANALTEVNIRGFKPLIYAASRSHETVAFCEEYAVVALKSSYFIQKGKCPVMSVQGPVLYQLLNYSDDNKFYWFNNGLAYYAPGDDSTVVFLEKYLPEQTVDSSIITRGIVKEKYDLNMRGILSVTQVMKSKFPDMVFDMHNGRVIMSNERGERITVEFSMESATTLEMRKALRGEKVGDLSSAKINIPVEIQHLMGLFNGALTIYVKERKIIFQAGTLYLVFGR